MADNFFQEQAIEVFKAQLIDIIRNQSTIRQIIPENTALAPSQNEYSYYKKKEQDLTQFNFEVSTPKYSKFATEEVNVAVPYIQGDLAFTRHEVDRLTRDVLPLDSRINELVGQLKAKEQRIGFAGDDGTGVTSFENVTAVTGNATAIATEVNLGTFTEGIQTFELAISQVDALLKSETEGVKYHMINTTDADDRAKSLFNDYTAESVYNMWVMRLGQLNGGNGQDFIHATNFLGGVEAETGTTNSAIVAAAPHTMELVTSDIEVIQGFTPQEDLQIQIGYRFVPILNYQGVKSIIYGGTSALT